MPLTTQPLTRASCNISKNPVLQVLWATVQLYNTLPPAASMNLEQKAQAVTYLDLIGEKCATYMTEKAYYGMKLTPQGMRDSRRMLRYQAFYTLMIELGTEMKSLGGRMITAHPNFRETSKDHENYWLERLDPLHRPGFVLSEYYKNWVNSAGKTGSSFWDRMEDVTHDAQEEWQEAVDQHAKAVMANPALPKKDGMEFMPEEFLQVWGYDQTVRWDQCVFFEGGILKCAINDSPFTTDDKETVYASKGWAIWVCSMPLVENPQSRQFHHYIFSGTHTRGLHHHTSFLAGKPVMAAGEWIVDVNGVIRVISAKSGHYRPSADELYNFVTTFQEIPGDALIRVDMSTKVGQIRYYRVSDFRSNLAAVKAGTFSSVPGAQVASVISQYAPKCAPALRKATSMI